MHRFNKNETDEPNHDNWEFVKKANEENWKTISISIGVQDYDDEFLNKCIKQGFRIDYITIDIAHAHSVRMKEMLEFIQKYLFGPRFRPFIIAGNVATPEAVRDLEYWGADSVKVGIAQGGACTTFGMTGFGEPMFSCMLACSEVAKKPLIADGGIKTNGDFAKAVRAGGTMVMAGSVFAACKDAPGENIYGARFDDRCGWVDDLNNIQKKIYYGSASEYNKGNKRHVEGTKLELPCNGLTYAEKYQEIADSYSSSVSYAGGNIKSVSWGAIYK
jgi:GMP reductase